MDSAHSPRRIIRVIDIETSGGAPPAEIIEVGWVDLVEVGGAWTLQGRGERLFKPARGIPPENRAIHHITEREIGTDAEACTAEALAAILLRDEPCALVAHNAAFERRFIGPDSSGATPWICTYKAAVRAWPNAPRHSNQVLRYWLNLDLDPAAAMPVHRAGPDAFVTANILLALLEHNLIEQLIGWTAEPRLYPTIRFGRHRGEAWSNIPADYLKWLASKGADIDTKTCAEEELRRRVEAEPA